MLLGKNELVFNQAQMNKVVEEWLSEHFLNTDMLPDGVKVTKVTPSGDAANPEFRITLEESEEE